MLSHLPDSNLRRQGKFCLSSLGLLSWLAKAAKSSFNVSSSLDSLEATEIESSPSESSSLALANL